MNNVVLVGRLTRDPELRTTSSGLATTTVTVAINGRPNANGERQTDFINVVVWRKQAENLCKFCQKGSLVGVQGRIQSRSYDAQDGTKRYVTEVVADTVNFLGSKNSNQTTDYGRSQSQYSGRIRAKFALPHSKCRSRTRSDKSRGES